MHKMDVHVPPESRASADSTDQSKLSKQDQKSSGYFDWLIKSYSYYATIDSCVKNQWNGDTLNDDANKANAKNSINNANGEFASDKKDAQNGSDGDKELSLSGANGGNWFSSSGGNPSIGLYMRDASTGDSMKVGSDGLIGCDDNGKQLVSGALKLWGISAGDILCHSGWRTFGLTSEQTPDECASFVGDSSSSKSQIIGFYRYSNNSKLFEQYVTKAVFNDSSVTDMLKSVAASKTAANSVDPSYPAALYIFYRHTLNESCIPGIDGTAPLEDRQYSPSSDTTIYKNVNWVDSSGNVKTGTYIAKNQDSKESGQIWYSDSPVSVGPIHPSSMTCSQVVSAMNNFASYYAIWLKKTNHPASVSTPSSTTSQTTSDSTACAINGIGWIVCPAVNFLANVADQAFTFMADNFLSISPNLLNTDEKSGAYKAWNMIRMLANAILVVAFLVIIYSQLSGLGISNYGIKRMLPRLIIIAILINISYTICRLCIDLSDILGYSLKSLLSSVAQVTQTIPDSLNNNWTTGKGFSGVAGSVLGGTAATVAATAASGGVTAALVAFLGVLVAAVIALIMIFFILTIRQVVIILLVVLSPLAIAAYLFPNTESLAKKWANIFRDMLLVFPIIGLVYGGCTLASSIIKSAWATSGSTLAEVVGAAVMVLPLFVVPTLLKGSIKALGSIGEKISGASAKLSGAAQKGISSSQLSQYAKAKNQEDKMRALAGNYRGNNPLRRFQSVAHKGLNSSHLYNLATRGYGASQYLTSQAQNRKDMAESIAMFNNDDDLTEAWASTGGDVNKARSWTGSNGHVLSNTQLQQMQRMRDTGLHRKSSSFLAAASAMSSNGSGNAAAIASAIGNASEAGATAAEVDTAWQGALAGYRRSGRGDVVGAMQAQFDANGSTAPIGASSFHASIGNIEKSQTSAWEQVASSSVHRNALDSVNNAGGLKSYQKFLNSSSENTRRALTGYDQMESRAQSSAEKSIIAAAREHELNDIYKVSGVDRNSPAGRAQQAAAESMLTITDIKSAKNYFGVR